MKIESQLFASLVLNNPTEIKPTLEMNLGEINMCLGASLTYPFDVVGMTAELLNTDSIVTKTRGEAFSIWLLRLYTVCYRIALHKFDADQTQIFVKIFEILKTKLQRQKRLTLTQQ
jgi:hypothetical protein